ncbi:MAG: hypothetical protein HY277_08800 [Ignavibacteriales bacterium]|nr:hypothetical protein [Ignavibacteriales bacterium]
MEWWNRKSLAIIVAVCVLMYSVVGCGPSTSGLKPLDKYDPLPYADAATFSVSSASLCRAATLCLQHKGYVLDSNNVKTGVMLAEITSSRVIPEEEKEHPERVGGSTTGSALLTFLGIILVVGLVAMLVSSPPKDAERDSEDTSSTEEDSHPAPTPTTPATVTYKYVVNLVTTSLSDTTSDLRIEVTKMELENGEVRSSMPFENKYLNYSIFDAIQEELDRTK